MAALLKLPVALLFLASGLGHFLYTGTYLRMMPPELPLHRELVLISGAVEIVLALLFMSPRHERWAAWGLIATLVAIFPANLHMYRTAGTPDAVLPSLSPFWAAVRLPLQGLLIAWIYRYTRRTPA
ncbi:MAG: DoxX family protein [Elusimicrobiota bacterium]|nr:MAG: DoxX family protein [Elusimicrobiota bacterium]